MAVKKNSTNDPPPAADIAVYCVPSQAEVIKDRITRHLTARYRGGERMFSVKLTSATGVKKGGVVWRCIRITAVDPSASSNSEVRRSLQGEIEVALVRIPYDDFEVHDS